MTPGTEAKTRFVLIDGISESLETLSQPLERDRVVSFDRLIGEIAAGRGDDDAFATLAHAWRRLTGGSARGTAPRS